MADIRLLLDSEKKNNFPSSYNFKQGTLNRTFIITPYNNGVEYTLTGSEKIELYFAYLDKSGNIIQNSPMVDENTPEYASIVEIDQPSNTIKVKPCYQMVDHAGSVRFTLKIDDLYSYDVTYTVDATDGYKTHTFKNTLPTWENKADKNLGNVDDSVFKAKAVKSGMLTNDATQFNTVLSNDVDFLAQKKTLNDVENDLGDKATSTLDNVLPTDMDKAIKLTNAYKQMSARTVDPLTPTEIATKIYYLETQTPISNWLPYKDYKFIHFAAQFTADNQTFTQTLPPTNLGHMFIVSTLFTGHKGCKLELEPFIGDQIDGTSQPKELSEDGIMGIAIPENTDNYDWIPYPALHDYGIAVSNENNDLHIGVKELQFTGATLVENPSTGALVVNLPTGASALKFHDGITNTDFTPTKVQSLDKSVRIANLGGVADFSVNSPNLTEGVFAKLGYTEDINTNYHDQRPYFSDKWSYTGMYIGEDKNDKAWTIQDGSMDDSNVTGGSAIRIGMYFEPLDNPTASEDGYVELKVIDVDTKDYLLDDEGNPVAIRRDYKAMDVIGNEILLANIKAKGQRKIAFEIDCSFPNQIITSSGNTAIYMQVINEENTSGIAEMLFQIHTGYIVKSTTRYYGFNIMNLAANLTKTKGEETLSAGTSELMGNGLFINAVTDAKVKIENNQITLKDNGVSLPVFMLGKIFDPLDTMELRLKVLNAAVKIQDKNNAFKYSLVKWTGSGQATLPIITGYSNENPNFASGWSEVSNKFISEDAVSGIHTDRNAFTVPDDAKQIAVIIYPATSQIPTTLTLADFEVDVSPAFTKSIIQNTSHLSEKHLEIDKYVYRAITKTPNGYGGLRYTINSTETRLPFGIVSGGDDAIVNDRSWNTSGNKWEVEGDGVFKDDGKVTISYSAQVYCGESVPASGTSNCEIWMAKKQLDGSFVEVPNSKTVFVMDKSFTGAKAIKSKEFTMDVKANDTFRMFAKSNIDDGCYLQSGTNGVPLLRLDVEYDEIVELSKDVLEQIGQNNEVKFVENGKEVYNKILQYDISSGKMTVIDKN